MPQFSIVADAVNVTLSSPSRLGTRGARVSQIAIFIAGSVLTFFSAGGITANGQTLLSPFPAQTTVHTYFRQRQIFRL
jgi:hypothetical protein